MQSQDYKEKYEKKRVREDNSDSDESDADDESDSDASSEDEHGSTKNKRSDVCKNLRVVKADIKDDKLWDEADHICNVSVPLIVDLHV